MMTTLLAVAVLSQLVSSQSSLDSAMATSKQQQEIATLCGPLSLARIISLHGSAVDFEPFLLEFESRTAEGVTIGDIVDVANANHLNAEAVSFGTPNIDALPLPCILLVDNDMHCLVLEDVRETTVRVWDPSSGKLTPLSKASLYDKWGGNGIVFERDGSHWPAVALGFGLTLLGFVLLYRGRRRPEQPIE